MDLHTQHVRSAASLVNAIAMLLYWLRQLPLYLPTPLDNKFNAENPNYVHFYATMQQVQFLLSEFPASLPRMPGINLLHAHGGPAPEASVPVPPPLPKPRRPRARGPSATGSTTAPEVSSAPAPQPSPRQTRNKRKTNFPKKLLN